MIVTANSIYVLPMSGSENKVKTKETNIMCFKIHATSHNATLQCHKERATNFRPASNTYSSVLLRYTPHTEHI